MDENNLTPEDLGKYIPTLLLMEQWCDSFRALLIQVLERGDVVPGADLVLKENTRRQWVKSHDEKELIRLLQSIAKKSGKPSKVDDVAPRAPRSVADMEKFVGKKAFEPFLNEVETVKTSVNTRLVLDA